MNQARYCQFQGHEANLTIYLCTYKDCKLDSKWICADCGVQLTHIHGQPNQNHLMKQQQFLDFIKKQFQPMLIQIQEDKRLVQICIKELKQLIKFAQILMQRLQEDLGAIQENDDLEEIEQIIKITKDNYFLLENKQIEKIININSNKKNFQYNLSQDVLKQLLKIDQDLQKFLENNFKIQNVQIKQQIISDNKNIYPNAQLVYESHFFNQQQSIIHTSQISYDEKYLVFGGSGCKIQVYDILTKQLIKSIQIEYSVSICRFTKDSKYLICGDSKGYLYCFDIKNNFDQQYKNQIHSNWITDILPINNDQIITCSSDKSIIITNFKQKTQQSLIKNAHSYQINTIDFDQYNDVIICGSSDKSIKFFNKTTGEMQFEKEDAHNVDGVFQIQLISGQDNNLLSSDWKNLILWQIDYHNKQLNQINVFNQKHYNFTSVANNNRIILICNDEVLILDQNLSLVQSINHDSNVWLYYYKTRQIDSMNYIIVQNVKNFKVLKKV